MATSGSERFALAQRHLEEVDTAATPFRVPVYIACTLLSVVLNYAFGKEAAFDSLHYHFYDGFSALNNRFGIDYFAAGAQSYFNPYAYAPFYALVKLGLPGLAIGTTLAMIHSVVLWITYELACTVCPAQSRRERLFFGLCATTLALMNPLLLQQIGSSFADITTSELVLGGWLLLARALRRPTMASVIFSAILLGCATALKPTNALHSIAGFAVLAFVPLPLLQKAKSLLCFGVTLGVSFALAAAPWSYRLAMTFGNPMFPLMNGIFKSPEFTTESLKHYRFVPESLGDALRRPFDMLSTADMIHDEMTAPDIRYALLLIVFLIFAIAWLWQSRRPAGAAPSPVVKASSRAVAALGCGFAVDWILWLDGSGNSRYFIPMACVAAVVAVALLFKLLINHTRGRNAILLALLAAQTTLLVLNVQYRWNAAPWEGRWFNVTVPEKLANEPNLYLSIGVQSNSFIVPFLAKGSGFVNFSGVYALGPEGANASRVKALIERSTPHLRVIVSGERIYPDSARRDPRQSDTDDALRAFGLRVDMADCETIAIKGLRGQIQRPWESSIPAPGPLPPAFRYKSYLASCHVVPDTRDESQEMAARRAVDIVLNHLEDACPALFIPRRSQSEHQDQVWLRNYPQTDLIAWVTKGELKFQDAARGPQAIVIGREEEWAKAPLPLECGRRHETFFANVLHGKQ